MVCLRLLVALSTCALLACSGDDGAVVDGGTPDAITTPDVGVMPPTPPAPSATPALPEVGPCPSGWREVAADASRPAYCAPWDEGFDPRSCAEDEAAFPGGGCVRLGSDCPTGSDLPAGLPASGVVYVDDDAAPGGDGSMGAPYQTIGAALAAVSTGQTVGIGIGTYDEAVVVPGGVTLRGACVRGVRIEPSFASAGSAVRLNGSAVITNVTLSGASAGLIASSGSSTAEDVVVDGATELGIRASGTAALTLRRVKVNELILRSGLPTDTAVLASNGGEIIIDQLSLVDVAEGGVVSSNSGSAITGTGLSIVGVRATAGNGAGLIAVEGSVEVDVVAIIETGGSSVAAQGASAELTISDAYLGEGGPGAAIASGLTAVQNASVRASRVTVKDAERIGVVAQNGASLTLTDTIVLGEGRSYAFEDSDVTMTRAFAGGAVENGLFAMGARITGEDVTVRGVDADARGRGLGFEIFGGASVDLVRVEIRDVFSKGIVVGQEGTFASLEDVTLAGVRVTEDPGTGAVVVADGARAEIARIAIEDADDRGVVVFNGSTLDVEDLSIRDIRTEAEYSAALFVQESSATVRRARFEDGASVDVGLILAPASLHLTDVEIVAPPEAVGGTALELVNGEAVLERVRVSDAIGSGITVAQGATATLTDVAIVDTHSDGNGVYGRALEIQASGVTATRLLVERAQEVAIAVFEAEGSLQGSDVHIHDTLARGCVATWCSDVPSGIGIGAYLGGNIELTDFSISDSELVGIQIAEAGRVRFVSGVVRRAPIGMNVQDETIDATSITQDVRFEDNGVNLDSVHLPVPDPGGATTTEP